MQNKIGVKESSAILAITCMPMLILRYLNHGIQISSSGYWINYLICSIIAYLFIKCICLLFKKNIAKKPSKITYALILLFSLFLCLYNFSLMCHSLHSLTKNSFSFELIAFITILAATICSVLGIEAITRCAYITFGIVCIIVAFIAAISFNGWDVKNFYPVFGKDVKSTFLDLSSIGIYTGLLSILALTHNLKAENICKALKRSYIIVFFFGLGLVFLCTIIIPYPMGDLYNFSLSALFSIAKSGSFFHRFEIMLIAVLLIILLNSLSFSIYVLSFVTAKICNTNDHRIFSLLIGTTIFYVNVLSNIQKLSLILCLSFAIVLLIYFICSIFIHCRRDEI